MSSALAIILVVATPAQADGTLLSHIGCGDDNAVHQSYPLPSANRALETGSLHVLVVGSSSTAGTGAGDRNAAYPAVTEALFDDSRLSITASGQGGEAARGALSRMAEEIARHQPDLVVWQVGTNDAIKRLDPDTVADVITRGITLIREGGIDVILIDPQYFPRSHRNARYASMIERMAELGVEQEVAIVRRYARMRRAGTEIATLLAGDKLHMSAAGHECLAQDLATSILLGLSKTAGFTPAD